MATLRIGTTCEHEYEELTYWYEGMDYCKEFKEFSITKNLAIKILKEKVCYKDIEEEIGKFDRNLMIIDVVIKDFEGIENYKKIIKYVKNIDMNKIGKYELCECCEHNGF